MRLRFKFDENMPRGAADWLRDVGHEVETVSQGGLAGRADHIVLDVCRSEDRVLVTLDVGFADILSYPPFSHAGIWVLRSPSQGIQEVLALLRVPLRLARTEEVSGRLWVVEPGHVRVRG